MSILQEVEDYIGNVEKTLKALSKQDIVRFIEMLEEVYKNGKKVITMGNGGHGATASHYVNDLIKHMVVGDDKKEIIVKKRMRALCLSDNVFTLTAYANDVGYECSFSEPLKNWVEEGDLVIGISSSGNSANIVNAFQVAKEKGAKTVCLAARDGGKAKKAVDLCIIVPTHEKPTAQETLYLEDLHVLICHLSVYIVRKKIQGK